jgi:hypothetical protein
MYAKVAQIADVMPFQFFSAPMSQAEFEKALGILHIVR